MNPPTPGTRASRLLIIDDNPVDVRIIRYTLKGQAGWLTELSVATNGEEAIDYLVNQVATSTVPRPDLVLLDLTLPNRDGTEVLHIIRSTEALANLAVVVTSCYPENIIREMVRRTKLDANWYLTKPSDIREYSELGRKLREYCLPSALELGRTIPG